MIIYTKQIDEKKTTIIKQWLKWIKIYFISGMPVKHASPRLKILWYSNVYSWLYYDRQKWQTFIGLLWNIFLSIPAVLSVGLGENWSKQNNTNIHYYFIIVCKSWCFFVHFLI